MVFLTFHKYFFYEDNSLVFQCAQMFILCLAGLEDIYCLNDLMCDEIQSDYNLY